MGHRDPKIRSRGLGAGMRRGMKKAGLTGTEVAQMLNWSESFVSLLLSGKRGASETACLFLELPEEIAAYRHILGVLADTALGEGESRELIAALANGLYADQEDHHDRP